jgi:branched-chain amino acid transport system ATP-binding protein
MSVLELDHVSAGYDGIPVVRDLSLHVEEGEVVALLGPNGAGKTTTLLTVSGLQPAIAGEVRVLGKVVDDRAPHLLARSGVAHVPEGRALFPSLTVADHLKIAAPRKAKADLAVVDRYFPALTRLMDRKAALLSGGEQQMLALARALLVAPRLLMIDEMSLGLAPIIVQDLLETVRTVAREAGCAVLLVEQHVQLALGSADRAYVLSHGDLILEGNTKDLIDDPRLLESSYLGEAAVETELRTA